jgi:UDP-glucose 4-epimerase
LDDEEIQIYGDGSQLRDLNYVDDVVDALLQAAVYEGANGRIMNLGNYPPVSLLQFCKTLLEVCADFGCGRGGYCLTPFPPEKKRIDIGDYYADYGRVTQTLGWQPRTPLREGLRRTVAYYTQFRDHYWQGS